MSSYLTRSGRSGSFADRRSRNHAISGGMVSQLTPEQAFRRFDEIHKKESSGVTVRSSFLQSSWVFAGVSIICDWMLQNPLVFENKGRLVDGGELVDLFANPNGYNNQSTEMKFRKAYMTELILSGAVMRIFPEMEGPKPKSMVVQPRNKFRPEWSYDEMGIQVVDRWMRTSGISRRVPYFPGDDIHHNILYNPFHDFEGLAPLTAAILGIRSDINLSELLVRFFENDASTGLIMSSDEKVNPGMLKQLGEVWNEMNSGIENAYNTKWISHGFKPHSMGSEFDAAVQRILKTMTKDEILTGILQIPPVIYQGQAPVEGVQIGARSSEPEKEAFLVNVIMQWAKRYDEEANLNVAQRFPGDWYVRHDFSNNPILERRRLERAKTAAELLDRGVTLNNLIRWMKLELDEEPHGDEFFVKRGQVPASVVMASGSDALLPPRARTEIDDSEIMEILNLATQGRIKELSRNESSGDKPLRELLLELRQ